MICDCFLYCVSWVLFVVLFVYFMLWYTSLVNAESSFLISSN